MTSLSDPAPERPSNWPFDRPVDPAPEPNGPTQPIRRFGQQSKPANAAVAGWTYQHSDRPEAAPVGRPQPGLDRRTAERLRKGTRTPDARIDLHGMTAARAHGVCLRFLGEAIAHGHRVVLVITGKGRGAGGGVLRESLPAWLRASPLGQSVVGIYQANRKHGGEGAFYVYLKRRR